MKKAWGRFIVIYQCNIFYVQCDLPLEDKESPSLLKRLKPHINQLMLE